MVIDVWSSAQHIILEQSIIFDLKLGIYGEAEIKIFRMESIDFGTSL